MQAAALDELPGFRRRFRVTPAAGCVRSEVEDDFHRMSVSLHHDGATVTAIEPLVIRAPWDTCPGAVEQLRQTFEGLALARFAERGNKFANCTHLYDLALLAAAHAFDDAPLAYDILVSDPVDGRRRAELRRDGATLFAWSDARLVLVEPPELAGLRLDQLGTWIGTLEPALREPARLLRWGNMIANGRVIPLEKQSDASRMPATCYTFQPQRAAVARRIGAIRDFSRGTRQLLEAREAAPPVQ